MLIQLEYFWCLIHFYSDNPDSHTLRRHIERMMKCALQDKLKVGSPLGHPCGV